MLLAGWRFATPDEKLPGENAVPDPLHPEFTHLRQLYFSVNPEYKGRFTVPVLYDKKTKQIVNNEVRLPACFLEENLSVKNKCP